MAAFATLFAQIERSRARRAAIRELQRFPAYQLADIGIFPDQIEDAVDGMLQRSEDVGRADRTRIAERQGSALAPLFAHASRPA